MTAKRLRIGIVGMTSDHVWFLGDDLAALPEVDIVCGAEPYPELRDRATKQWGLLSVYEDYVEMLERESLDAILVCSDNAAKPAIVEAAAARGVHVYQDKPMGATLADADRILRAVESSGITLMVAYHTAFDPQYAPVKALLAGGAIGRPFLARGVSGHGGPVEYGCTKYFCEWLFDKSRNGGGTFVDEACYLVDTFLDYLGPIADVSAFTAQIGHRDYLPAGVEDSAVAILRFRSGALGIIDSKWGQVGPAPVRLSYTARKGRSPRACAAPNCSARPARRRRRAGNASTSRRLAISTDRRPACRAGACRRRRQRAIRAAPSSRAISSTPCSASTQSRVRPARAWRETRRRSSKPSTDQPRRGARSPSRSLREAWTPGASAGQCYDIRR
jgi:predicted dehydrogenase